MKTSTVTHLPLALHVSVGESNQHWFKWWLVAYSSPTHYLEQCWVLVNWTIRNELPGVLIKMQYASFTKMHLKNIVWEMVVILPRDRWVKISCHDWIVMPLKKRFRHVLYLIQLIIFDCCCSMIARQTFSTFVKSAQYCIAITGHIFIIRRGTIMRWKIITQEFWTQRDQMLIRRRVKDWAWLDWLVGFIIANLIQI